MLLLAVRTALVALIAFMPTKPDGALGSLDYTKEERHALAIKSRDAPPKFGNPERQKLIDEIHEYMLSKVPPVPKFNPTSDIHSKNSNNGEGETSNNSEGASDSAANVEELANVEPEQRIEEDVREVHLNANAGILRVNFSAELRRRRPPATSTISEPETLVPARGIDDRLFTLVAVGLVIAIAVLLAKKYLNATG